MNEREVKGGSKSPRRRSASPAVEKAKTLIYNSKFGLTEMKDEASSFSSRRSSASYNAAINRIARRNSAQGRTHPDIERKEAYKAQLLADGAAIPDEERYKILETETAEEKLN